MHEFRDGTTRYGAPDVDEDAPEDLVDDAEVKLAEALPRKSSRLLYVYDFGDDWEHTGSVERIEADAPSQGGRSLRPRRRAGVIECLDGARSGPPEDCGGPAGYADFLDAMRDTANPEHAAMREWIGGDFDPELCNVADINRRLARIA